MVAITIRPYRAVFMLLLAVVSTGCQPGQFSYYISPQVTGRVMAADTRQPLADVKVQRVVPYQNPDSFSPPKGGQILMQRTHTTWTDGNGGFVLASENIITPFRRPNWSKVTVTFECSGYENFRTNFNAADFKDRSPEGEPLVPAGDVLLRLKSN